MRTWPHFSDLELRCKCKGEYCTGGDMDDGFMEALEQIRRVYGRPMIIASGFRCPRYNDLHASTGLNGPHTTGKAVDVKIFGPNAYDLMYVVMNQDFMRGLGFHQKGPHSSRYIHLDSLRDSSHPRPYIWTY
jgi:zinc D-Ala-D-Ala carboxypeptidase